MDRRTFEPHLLVLAADSGTLQTPPVVSRQDTDTFPQEVLLDAKRFH